ncbi:MAG: GNAT family acetyltransferase [Chloroflexi bacterium]|nr:GNAT family acetyltransferase [Chloroflexota bacterium]
MTELVIRPYQESDQQSVVKLWRDCGLVVASNDPVKDIHRKLEIQQEMFLVGVLDTRLVAAMMAGYEGHRGWINYLAVEPGFQGAGIGSRIMEEAEARLRTLGCPKINLQIRRSNADVGEFYKKIGYSVDDVVSMGKHLVED